MQLTINGKTYDVPGEYMICSSCRGVGMVVAEAMSVWTMDDIDNDPDTFENMMAGAYDVQCPECHGLRVVEVPIERLMDPELLEEYYAELDADADYQAEREWERRFGC